MNQRSPKILFRDTLLPVYLVGAVWIGAIWKWDIPWPASPDALLGAALTVGSVVVGFLISAKAIIISTSGRGVQRMKEMGLMIELADAFAVAVYLAMAFTVTSCIGLFGVNDRWYEALWAGLGIGMMFSFLRISRVLFRLVREA